MTATRDWTEHIKVLRTQADAFCPPHYPGTIPETFRSVARQYREVADFLARGDALQKLEAEAPPAQSQDGAK